MRGCGRRARAGAAAGVALSGNRDLRCSLEREAELHFGVRAHSSGSRAGVLARCIVTCYPTLRAVGYRVMRGRCIGCGARERSIYVMLCYVPLGGCEGWQLTPMREATGVPDLRWGWPRSPKSAIITFFLATFSAARGCESDSSTPQAPPEAKVIKGRRPHSPAGGGEICHLWVQNGHFPYIFEGLIADSKNQKDAHLKMRSIGTE